MNLTDFVRESNRIEGILREPTDGELISHVTLLQLASVTVADLTRFVRNVAGANLRSEHGMNVYVGNHRPPEGGPQILFELGKLLDNVNAERYSVDTLTPYHAHIEYETLHPFMDGNGRSGRALWLWMHHRVEGNRAWELGFLHRFYYEALENSGR